MVFLYAFCGPFVLLCCSDWDKWERFVKKPFELSVKILKISLTFLGQLTTNLLVISLYITPLFGLLILWNSAKRIFLGIFCCCLPSRGSSETRIKFARNWALEKTPRPKLSFLNRFRLFHLRFEHSFDTVLIESSPQLHCCSLQVFTQFSVCIFRSLTDRLSLY